MALDRRLPFAALSLALLLAGCAADQSNAGGAADRAAPPLTSADTLLAGAPDNSQLPAEGKADAVYPPKYSDLVALQSPIRDQGHRGICSIFSTVALMEHLYIKEGTYKNPDFSEQYLQWAVKNEVGSFPHTSGSTAASNIEAINKYGIVEEDVWPYNRYAWSASDDPACGEDNKPIRCFTGGEPPAEAESAPKFKLPPSRWISTRPDDIKAYMTEHEEAVVVGVTFFYQAWNHGASKLPINRDYYHKGYVMYPNDTDKQKSLEEREGHSVLLVGWDDTLEVQRMDKDGNPMVDADGKPVMEKGFWIFKNSWGTGSFGRDNPYGDGYGFISMKYVQEYGHATGADMPVLHTPDEVCGDGKDNDGNGQTDCQDAACADQPACQPTNESKSYSNTDATAIPDNDPDGIVSTIEVPDAGTISALSVTVDITHPYNGDLNVVLEHPGGDVVILAESGDSSDNDLKKTFVVDDFNGLDAKGTWKLDVWDDHQYDEGTLNKWSLDITY